MTTRAEYAKLSMGRMTFDDWMTLITAHDANHVDQLQRALRGQP